MTNPAPVTNEPPRRTRDTEMGRLRGQAKRERALARMAQRAALDAEARAAEAEHAQARAEARHAKLKAQHAKAVAEHQHALDSATDRAEQAEAALSDIRVNAQQALTELEPHGLPDVEDYLNRVLAIINRDGES